MVMVAIGEIKNKAKSNSGLTAYPEAFAKYAQALSGGRFKRLTRVACLEYEVSKHRHFTIKDGEKIRYLVGVPAQFKDGSKGEKVLIKRACNPLTNECAYLATWRQPQIEV